MPHRDPETGGVAEARAESVLSETSRQIVENIVEALRPKRGALLPILHAIQGEFGFIPEASIPLVADRLNLTRAEVYGVVTFYHDFRRKETGRRVLKICLAESCQALGSHGLVEAARESLGVDFEGTTKDGVFTLRKVFCLGNCALSPSVAIDADVHGMLTPDGLRDLITRTRKKAESER
jgi:formate dehydrogenase subunit gamma